MDKDLFGFNVYMDDVFAAGYYVKETKVCFVNK